MTDHLTNLVIARQALNRLALLLERASGESMAILADGLSELAARAETYVKRHDSPEAARLKAQNALKPHDRTP